jgi:hypothetical protein
MIPVARPDTLDVIEAALGAIYTKDEKTELERARDYYAQIPPPPKAYPFSRYKVWKVCCALDTLFHDKCAYCESSYQAVDSRDVEHFRPKGGVTEAPLHPGYWWLAAKWSNLLPSCPPCNQRRRQLTYDPTKTLEEFDRLRLVEPQFLSGKANSFPLRGNNWIDREDGDVSTEDPLLINPCERDPNSHLQWIFDWDRQDSLWEAEVVTASLKPRSVDGVEDPYAKASIAIYGLNRAGLVRERMARIKEMQLILGPVADTMSDLAAAPRAGADHDRLLARLNKYREKFRLAFTAPDRPYAGMARAFTAQFAKEFSQRMSL